MSIEIITSPQNPRIKRAAALRRGHARGAAGRILIDGGRELSRALSAGVRIEEVFLCPEALGATDEWDRRAQSAGAIIFHVSRSAMDRLAYGDRCEGVVAVAQRPRRALSDLRIGPTPLLAVLVALEKPGNLGAIARSADAAGLDGLIVVDAAADLFGPNVVRASIGTIFTVPTAEATADEAMQWLEARGIALVAASPDGRRLFTAIDLSGPVAVVLGGEAEGLPAIWRSNQITTARIPMRGQGDSLNVSTCAALFFFEAVRQRGGPLSGGP